MKSSTDRVEYYGVVAGLGYPLPLLSPGPWPTCRKVELQIHVTVMKSSTNTPPGGSRGMLPQNNFGFQAYLKSFQVFALDTLCLCT